jgi:hypothetical protein
MNGRSIRTAAVIAALAGLSLAAQAHPDFSGKWVAVPDAAGGGRGGAGGVGQTAAITQDATAMTVTRTTQMGEFTSTYKLDGSESRNTLNFQGNAIEQVSKTRWDGNALIVNTSMSFDGNPVEVSMKLWLDEAGNLKVETTRPDFQGGGAPVTTTTTYKKG